VGGIEGRGEERGKGEVGREGRRKEEREGEREEKEKGRASQ
jgi:hypothetical protein